MYNRMTLFIFVTLLRRIQAYIAFKVISQLLTGIFLQFPGIIGLKVETFNNFLIYIRDFSIFNSRRHIYFVHTFANAYSLTFLHISKIY